MARGGPFAATIVATIVVEGSKIMSRAFLEAYRQAARNAAGTGARGAAAGAAGGAAAGASKLTRDHNMTVDEAAQILNVNAKQLQSDEEMAKMLENYDRLFKANEPFRNDKPHSSVYLQSKVIAARRRIEAEYGPKDEKKGE